MYKNRGGGGYLASKNSSNPVAFEQDNGQNQREYYQFLQFEQNCKNVKLCNKKSYTNNKIEKSNVNCLGKRNEFLSMLKSKRFTTTQIVLWLLAICTLVALTLTPIFSASRNLALDAGQTRGDVQFTNSPWIQVNDGNALFTSGNGINAETLYDLLLKVNQTSVWSNYKTENSNTYLSAKNFGKLDPTGYGQLQVKLFDGATLGEINTTDNTDLNIDGATALQWQAVYRSMDGTRDVLTLYMNDVYCNAYFDNNSPIYGYYKDSNLREVVQKSYMALKSVYSSLDAYTVYPQNIPGQWQSNAYQTGSDRLQTSYTLGASLGFSGATYDAINNGLDTLGTLRSDWTNRSTTTTNPYNSDKLFVPSSYEVIYKDSSTDGITTAITNSSSAEATLKNSESGGSDGETDGRTGLWELTGYDRASGAFTWVRSGNTVTDVSTLFFDSGGGANRGNATSEGGVRVALHLDLQSLADAALGKITASANQSTISNEITGVSNIQTVRSDFNYANYVIKNSTDTRTGTRTIVFDAVNTSQYKVWSFTLQSGSTAQKILVREASGSGVVNGLCDYSYVCSNGQLQVIVNNIQTSTLSVCENIVDSITLNLQINNNAVNSLLMLSLLDGENKICEYGYVNNAVMQVTSVILPMGATIRLVATKPFGSSIDILLNGATLSSSNSISYDFVTGISDTQTLVVNLSSNNQRSNAMIVI